MTFCVGIMLRALLEKEELHKTLLKIEYIEKLSNYIMDATFDVASDAIDSLTVNYLSLIGNTYIQKNSHRLFILRIYKN